MCICNIEAEVEFLKLLETNPRIVFSKEQIYDLTWKGPYLVILIAQ